MKSTGACFCGEIEYEAVIDESRVGICHCRDCQIMSGSAFRVAALVDPGSFTVTRGSPTSFDKTAENGKMRRMMFCGRCGTSICSMPGNTDEAGAFVSLRVMTLKEHASLKPRAEIWCGSKLPWVPTIEGTVKLAGQP